MSGFAEDNAPYSPSMTKAEFLSWVQRQERRHDLVGGRTIMHAGSTKRHNWVAQNVVAALRARLDAETWSIGFADVAVVIGADIRYPDVLVERLDGDGRELTSEAPVLIAEILSPSSIGTDMSVKLAEYTSLASLEAYIVASQDEVIAWVWLRDDKTRAFSAKPKEISGADTTIEIAALGLALPLSEFYRGIKTGS